MNRGCPCSSTAHAQITRCPGTAGASRHNSVEDSSATRHLCGTKEDMNRASDHRIVQPWEGTGEASQDRPVIINDWSLLIGFRVHVRLNRCILRYGRVEEVSSDGNALWIEAGHGFGRQLIDQGSGFQVLLDPHLLAPLGQRRTAGSHGRCRPEPARKR
jgi:hypothetical protein